jgi:Domain of unknown function (DUF5666)
MRTVTVRWTRWTAALAALALLAALVGAVALQPGRALAADPTAPATEPPVRADRVAGHVTATGEQSLALQSVRGDAVSVHYTDQTTCTFNDGSARSACSEIAAGDFVVARGNRAGASDQFTADAIRVTPPVLAGHVTAVAGASLTVQSHDGSTATVTYDDTTACSEQKQPIDCSTIVVGDRVAADGATSGGTMLAKHIAVIRQHAAGEVTAVDGGVLALQSKQGDTATVALSGTTKCYEDKQPSDCSTIAVGDHVAAGGFLEGGVLQAIRVDVVTKLPAIRGTVTSADGRTFQLQATDGTTYQVHWGDDTTCTTKSGPAGCDTIAVGDRAAVRGTDLGADNVQAKRIAFRHPRPRPTAAPAATPGA